MESRGRRLVKLAIANYLDPNGSVVTSEHREVGIHSLDRTLPQPMQKENSLPSTSTQSQLILNSLDNQSTSTAAQVDELGLKNNGAWQGYNESDSEFCEEDDSRDQSYEFDEAANESSDSYESEMGVYEAWSHIGSTEYNDLPLLAEPEPQLMHSAESCDNEIQLFESDCQSRSHYGEISEILLIQPEVPPVAPVQDVHQTTTKKQNNSSPAELLDELLDSCESQSITYTEQEIGLTNDHDSLSYEIDHGPRSYGNGIHNSNDVIAGPSNVSQANETAGTLLPPPEVPQIAPSQQPPPKKRKQCNPSEWKKNKIRIEKKESLLVKPLKVPRCLEKRTHSCSTDFPEVLRQRIYNQDHSLETITDQRQFLVRHVSEQNVRTSDLGRKKKTKMYHLTKEHELIKVCREFFLDTLNISEGLVRGAFRKLNAEGVLQRELRGKHPPKNKLSSADDAFIRENILAFPSVESHYCRKESEFRYLAANLNMTKMYELYKIRCIEEKRRVAGFEKYRRIFRDYKLTFHVPMKDYCKTCSKFEEMKKVGLSEEDQLSFDEHLRKKEAARNLKNEWKQKAQLDDNILAFEFDLQAVLSTPKGAQGPFFYVRKLAVYNLTVYNLGDASVECFVWDETEGKRGSVEISTCIFKYIMKFPLVTTVAMFSDSCGGQQKNANFVSMCLEAAKVHLSVQEINHIYFEPGHSLMECDSIHQKIFKTAKPVPVYTPEEWIQQIRNARKNPAPYNVTALTHSEFIDFNAQRLTFSSVEDNNKGMAFRKAAHFRFVKLSPGVVQMKGDHEENFESFTLKRKRGRPSSSQVQTPYSSRFPVTEAKKKDLKKLCDDLQIPPVYHDFYHRLPTSHDVRDALPEPDANEADDSE